MHCGVTPVSAVLLYWLLVYGGLGRDAAQAALNLGSAIQLLNAISSAPRARYLNEETKTRIAAVAAVYVEFFKF